MNIDCATCESRMEAYVDGTLADAERNEVVRHLDHCVRCGDHLKSEHALREALKTLPVISCPDAVLVRIRKETNTAEPPVWKRLLQWPGWLHGWKIPAFATACLLMLLFIGRPLWNESSDRSVYYPGDGLEARTLATLSLVYVGQTIRESKERAFEEVFSGEIPNKVHHIIRSEVPLFGGKSP